MKPLIIQVERPGQHLNFQDIQSILEDTGIQLDRDYGPILINPQLGRFVVRGMATRDAMDRAAHIQGVHLFSDVSVAPLLR